MRKRKGFAKVFDIALEKWKRFQKQVVGRDVWSHRQVKYPVQQQGDYRFFVSPGYLDATSTVLSFGVGEELSFDLALMRNFDVTVFAFDPTPPSAAWVKKQRLPENFRFFDFGIAGCDGVAKFTYHEKSANNFRKAEDCPSDEVICTAKVYRLRTILDMLHLHNGIDLMKLNIEGSEYEVIDDIVQSDIPIRQLVVAFHHRFRNMGIAKTRKAIRLLNSRGYRIFHVDYKGEIYSFIKPDPVVST